MTPYGGGVPGTTVVVVTWRGRAFVGACLDALAAQTTEHALLVVDNASTDGTADVLAAHPSRPEVLRLKENAGYAGAMAAAMEHVRTPNLAWLNDDAEPEPGWLAALEDTATATGAAAVGSLLLHPDGRVQSRGVGLTALGYGVDLDGPGAGAVFGFCGGAALTRLDALRAVGGVPAGFFCYYEDTDTAWRLRLAGHDVLTAPGARVRHRHGATSTLGSPLFHHWNERNRLLMLLRCAPAGIACRELARFAALTAKFAVRPGTAPNHRFPVRLRVLAAVAAMLPATLAQRASVGASRRRRREVWAQWCAAADGRTAS
jgi:GT2 family glycosyltransferase